MDFKTELQGLIAKYQGDPASMVKHLQAHTQAVQNAAEQGHSYVVFPDEADANYGNPFGGPTEDGSPADDPE